MSGPALLVVDTCGERCGALLRRAGHDDVEHAEDIGRGHDRRLAPLVRDLLAEAGVRPREVTRLGVCVGPGSFTGVRVGVAFVRGLALALARPAVGVNALDALGWCLRDAPVVVAAHDARRGDVVWRGYQHGVPRGDEPPRLQPAGEVAATLAGEPAGLVLAGSGVELVASRGHGDSGLRAPPLRALADLAERLDPAIHPARPFHHRPPDATPSRGEPPKETRRDV